MLLRMFTADVEERSMQTGFGTGMADGNNAYLNREYISGQGASSLSSSVVHITQPMIYRGNSF
jgi:hypothetical protein